MNPELKALFAQFRREVEGLREHGDTDFSKCNLAVALAVEETLNAIEKLLNA